MSRKYAQNNFFAKKKGNPVTFKQKNVTQARVPYLKRCKGKGTAQNLIWRKRFGEG